jgi:peptidoglycan/xylan/chitin deacetylase (PgdA/CDA1 family)
MRKLKSLILISVCFAGSLCVNSQTTEKPYEVAIWNGFTQTAVNYTFDDGCSNQFAIARPMFDELGFPMTLFTVTSWSPNWTVLKEMAANGHEIASHTVTHPNFGHITVENQTTELRDSKETIDNKIPDNTWQTLAYPYCVKGVDSIVNKYYIAARGCQGFIEFKTPIDYLNVSSVIVGDQGTIKSVANFKTNFENAAQKNGWLVFLIHGIDNDGGYSPISSTELQKSLDFLSPRTSKFWVTTFGNAARYAKERDAVTVKEILNQDTLMTLTVTDTLVDSIYNLPITIRRPLPQDWPSADVTQDSVVVPRRIVKTDTIVYLTFDVVPDAGNVMLMKNNTYVVPDIDTIPVDTSEENHLNIQGEKISGDLQASSLNQVLYITLPSTDNSEYVITLYDLNGVNIFSRKVKSVSGSKKTFSFSLNYVKTGLYIVKVNDNKNIWSKMVLF